MEKTIISEHDCTLLKGGIQLEHEQDGTTYYLNYYDSAKQAEKNAKEQKEYSVYANKIKARYTSLKTAAFNPANSDVLAESEKIYQWLIKDL